MKETSFTSAVDKVVARKMQAIDRWLEKNAEPLEAIGNPESLLGKPYELWTPQDKMMLSQIYGAEPNPLSNLIFRKEYEKLKELEKGV